MGMAKKDAFMIIGYSGWGTGRMHGRNYTRIHMTRNGKGRGERWRGRAFIIGLLFYSSCWFIIHFFLSSLFPLILLLSFSLFFYRRFTTAHHSPRKSETKTNQKRLRLYSGHSQGNEKNARITSTVSMYY